MVEQKVKKKKEKPPYTTWQNMTFTISNMWKWDKLLVFLCVAQAPFKVLLQLAGLYIVKLVISLIENNYGVEMFIVQITVFSAVVLLLNIISNIISAKIEWRQFKIRFNYMHLLIYKTMDTDYENIENPDGMNKMQKAFQTTNSNTAATQNIVNLLVDTATSIIAITTISAIITSLNPFIFIAITTLTLIQYFFNRAGGKWHYRNAKNYAPYGTKCFRRTNDLILF